MFVKVLMTDPRLGIKSGEVYEAERYRLDPDKVTLLRRHTDGYDPECNQYISEIEFVPRPKVEHKLKKTRSIYSDALCGVESWPGNSVKIAKRNADVSCKKCRKKMSGFVAYELMVAMALVVFFVVGVYLTVLFSGSLGSSVVKRVSGDCGIEYESDGFFYGNLFCPTERE